MFGRRAIPGVLGLELDVSAQREFGRIAVQSPGWSWCWHRSCCSPAQSRSVSPLISQHAMRRRLRVGVELLLAGVSISSYSAGLERSVNSSGGVRDVGRSALAEYSARDTLLRAAARCMISPRVPGSNNWHLDDPDGTRLPQAQQRAHTPIRGPFIGLTMCLGMVPTQEEAPPATQSAAGCHSAAIRIGLAEFNHPLTSNPLHTRHQRRGRPRLRAASLCHRAMQTATRFRHGNRIRQASVNVGCWSGDACRGPRLQGTSSATAGRRVHESSLRERVHVDRIDARAIVRARRSPALSRRAATGVFTHNVPPWNGVGPGR